MQAGALQVGCTGLWVRAGNTWLGNTISNSLRRAVAESIADSQGAAAAALPLWLAYCGHEGTSQSLQEFQGVRTGTSDAVAQVSPL